MENMGLADTNLHFILHVAEVDFMRNLLSRNQGEKKSKQTLGKVITNLIIITIF